MERDFVLSSEDLDKVLSALADYGIIFDKEKADYMKVVWDFVPPSKIGNPEHDYELLLEFIPIVLSSRMHELKLLRSSLRRFLSTREHDQSRLEFLVQTTKYLSGNQDSTGEGILAHIFNDIEYTRLEIRLVFYELMKETSDNLVKHFRLLVKEERESLYDDY